MSILRADFVEVARHVERFLEWEISLPLHSTKAIWPGLGTVVPLLFNEANPMPITYCLWRQGMITSPECRLSLTSISRALADELDRLGHGRLKSAT